MATAIAAVVVASTTEEFSDTYGHPFRVFHLVNLWLS